MASRNPRDEAEALLKKAEGSMSASLLSFRLSPDWETAGPLFERAALLFKQSNDLPRAISSLERAAQCQEKMGSPWHAAKYLESCATMSAQLAAATGAAAVAANSAASFARRAAHLFAENGRATTGVETLSRVAKSLETASPQEAAALYEDALDMAEAADSGGAGGGGGGGGAALHAADAFRAAIALALSQGRWSDAASLGLRFGEACEKAGARASQARAYLGAVVAYLHAGDAAAAWAAYSDVEPVGGFASSEEAAAARVLFDAYREGSEEAVKAAVAKCSVLRHLDGPSARLAVKLPSPGSELRAMAAALGEAGAGGGGGAGGIGGDDEEDIT